jgi:hypothetical protein
VETRRGSRKGPWGVSPLTLVQTVDALGGVRARWETNGKTRKKENKKTSKKRTRATHD